MLGLVGEHRRAGNVADRVDAGNVGLAVAIDDDAAAVGLDTKRFETKVLDIALNADGGDHPVGGDLFNLAVLHLDMGSHRVRALLDLRHLGFKVDLHTLLFELLLGDV
ncbi:hypothetical protein D3C72_2229470 [compost metagenome]